MDTHIDRDAIAAMDLAGLPDPGPTARLPSRQAAGRGAVTNPNVRFDSQEAVPFDEVSLSIWYPITAGLSR